MPQSWKKGNGLCYFPFYDQKAEIGFHRQFRLLVFERSVLDKKSFANIYIKAIASPFLKKWKYSRFTKLSVSGVQPSDSVHMCIYIFRYGLLQDIE